MQLSLPVPISTILLFVAHLYSQVFAATPITTTLSALSYFHKVNGHPDPSNNFIVSKVVAGARNLRTSFDVRLPVTAPILGQLIHALSQVFASHYKCIMLRAIMVLAFRAYLRVGEMTPRSKNTMQGCLHVTDIIVAGESISITFRQFKHSRKQGPQFVQVRGERIPNTSIYPAAFLQEFIKIRGHLPGPFAFPGLLSQMGPPY